jgi:hypothetical protein
MAERSGVYRALVGTLRERDQFGELRRRWGRKIKRKLGSGMVSDAL